MRKKLIETALPLEAINEAAAREKNIRHGHPSTLHLYWARRPLAACRAVLFASFVDDPAEDGVPQAELDLIDALPAPYRVERKKDQENGAAAGWKATKDLVYRGRFTDDEIRKMPKAELRRQKLFSFIETLVQWENSNDTAILKTARDLIFAACEGNPPPVLDPFCGGGSIPLEAQRLGLEAHGSDLNPLAVLITKAMIEIPPKFTNQPPISAHLSNPSNSSQKSNTPTLQHSNTLLPRDWPDASGLAEDVRYYGEWMREEALKRIGHLYPTVKVTAEMAKDRPDLKPYVGKELTVIAWLWARTVPSPDPAARGAHIPLVRSFELSKKKGKETWIEPVVDRTTMTYRFVVETKASRGHLPEGTIGKKGGRCIVTGAPMSLAYVREQGQARRLGSKLLTVVVAGKGERIYLNPEPASFLGPVTTRPTVSTDVRLNGKCRVNVSLYGFDHFSDLFTPRQLVALSTFSDLVKEARDRAEADGRAAGLDPTRATEYANAIATYLAFGVSRLTDIQNSLCRWEITKTQVRNLFSRQAIPMVWDYAENNVFNDAAGDFRTSLENLIKALSNLPALGFGVAKQLDARESIKQPGIAISTDPPYYDNIGYADLSDFFYVWLRRSLEPIDPSLVRELATPKTDELIATPYRHGGSKEKAKEFFETGLRQVFSGFAKNQADGIPISIFYAFKQTENEEDDDDEAETKGDSAVSTGWETMLQGLVDSGLMVTATWPMRTELKNKITMNTNILASSIVLACRPRPADASRIRRADFRGQLKIELAQALDVMKQGTVSPVDFAQAAIGPGMAVFSRYTAVQELDGKPMRVRSALMMINEVLAEVVDPVDADPETRWALKFYEDNGWHPGTFDDATKWARTFGVGMDGLVRAGFVRTGGGFAKLLDRTELPLDYDPATDPKTTIWEVVQYLIRELQEKGIDQAGRLLRRFRDTKPNLDPDRARDLCYTLYTMCDRKGWSKEAGPYNALAQEWEEIDKAAKRESSRWDAGKLDV